jgi:NADPH:quinone reductase-like Zn-dependent oxidoreductase
MKAVVLDAFGDLESIQVRKVAKPSPKENEILIEVKYAGINPVDWKLGAGYKKELWEHHFPLILGWDCSGVVAEVGSGVEEFSVGDEVYACCRKKVVQWGSYCEYICMEASGVAKKPRNLSFAEAAAIPLVALTAWQAFFNLANLQSEQKVFINGGAGGVGSLAIQMAKHFGAEVYTTTRSENNLYVRQMGADCCIDYSKMNFVQRVQELAPGGVDIVLDCVGGDTLASCYAIVRPGGWLISLVELPDVDRAEAGGFHSSSIVVRPNGQQLEEITTLLENDNLVAPCVQEYSIDDVVPALEQIKTEHTRGKIVLKISSPKSSGHDS